MDMDQDLWMVVDQLETQHSLTQYQQQQQEGYVGQQQQQQAQEKFQQQPQFKSATWEPQEPNQGNEKRRIKQLEETNRQLQQQLVFAQQESKQYQEASERSSKQLQSVTTERDRIQKEFAMIQLEQKPQNLRTFAGDTENIRSDNKRPHDELKSEFTDNHKKRRLLSKFRVSHGRFRQTSDRVSFFPADSEIRRIKHLLRQPTPFLLIQQFLDSLDDSLTETVIFADFKPLITCILGFLNSDLLKNLLQIDRKNRQFLVQIANVCLEILLSTSRAYEDILQFLVNFQASAVDEEQKRKSRDEKLLAVVSTRNPTASKQSCGCYLNSLLFSLISAVTTSIDQQKRKLFSPHPDEFQFLQNGFSLLSIILRNFSYDGYIFVDGGSLQTIVDLVKSEHFSVDLLQVARVVLKRTLDLRQSERGNENNLGKNTQQAQQLEFVAPLVRQIQVQFNKDSEPTSYAKLDIMFEILLLLLPTGLLDFSDKVLVVRNLIVLLENSTEGLEKFVLCGEELYKEGVLDAEVLEKLQIVQEIFVTLKEIYRDQRVRQELRSIIRNEDTIKQKIKLVQSRILGWSIHFKNANVHLNQSNHNVTIIGKKDNIQNGFGPNLFTCSTWASKINPEFEFVTYANCCKLLQQFFSSIVGKSV